jgi:hypothetical protein
MGLFGERPSAVHDPKGYNDQTSLESFLLGTIANLFYLLIIPGIIIFAVIYFF